MGCDVGTSIEMAVHQLDPIQDARWKALLQRHPGASVFHTAEWLEALRRTYGYRPVVFTTSLPTAELTNGLVFCCIHSWLTGKRLVSLPFSDHCDTLVSENEDPRQLLSALLKHLARERWGRIEIRPRNGDALGFGAREFQPGESYYFHQLDLQQDSDAIFRSFQKNSIQRKIRRAEKEGLIYEEGRSEALLRKFYHLMLLTRRRHQLPPQPFGWFCNLTECIGERLKIRLASKDGQPIAAIITLSYKDTMVYKYGCSDARFHNHGGMPFLLWKAIQEAKAKGARVFDLGRSDLDNASLVTFKERLGATRLTLTYLSYPAGRPRSAHAGWQTQVAKRVFALMPDRLLATTGKLLYRHIG